MDTASSTATNLATSAVSSPNASSTAAAIASNFGWLSIKEVFLMVVLYIWYMFLFMACFAIIVGGIWLLCMAIILIFGSACQHGPGLYSSSKERLGKFWKSSRRQGQDAAQATSQSVEPQQSGVENGGENTVNSKFGTETV